MKNDAQIASFSESGLKFENGSHLDADVVIFATGYGDAREPYRKLLSDEMGEKLKPIWGLDSEGEINGAWRGLGIPRLYCMMGASFGLSSWVEGHFDAPPGNLALCRFHSKHVALRTCFSLLAHQCTHNELSEIKAVEEGIWDGLDRYSQGQTSR